MHATVFDALANTLNTVLSSRLQRKAKSIILSCVEIIIVDFAILSTFLQYDINNNIVEIGLKATIYTSAVYAGLVALSLFLHSLIFLKVDNMKTSENVEKAYARTNSFAVVDGILELPFPFLFKGYLWYLPYFAWSVCVAVIVTSSYLYYVVREQLSAAAVSTLVAEALLLYQVTADFSEYWVQSRNRQIVSNGDGANNRKNNRQDGDVEDRVLVGTRGTSSAGFTRLD